MVTDHDLREMRTRAERSSGGTPRPGEAWQERADREFLQRAREDVLLLLDEVERLRALPVEDWP